MKLAIQLDKKGLVKGWQVVASDEKPNGFDAIVELEEGELLGGPEVIPSHKYVRGELRRRSKKEIAREIRKKKLKADRTPTRYFQPKDSVTYDSLLDISNLNNRVRELIVVAIALSISIGLVGSSLFSVLEKLLYERQILLGAGLLTGAVVLIYLSREYQKKLAVLRLPTAIVVQHGSRILPIPKVIALSQRLSSIQAPLMLALRPIYKRAYDSPFFSASPFRLHESVILLGVLQLLSFISGIERPNTIGERIDVGPLSGFALLKALPHYIQSLSDCCTLDSDFSLISSLLPNFRNIALPIGMRLSISLQDYSKPVQVRLNSDLLSLTVTSTGGTGSQLAYSPWNRHFHLPSTSLYVNSVVFNVTLKYGGFLKTVKSRIFRRGHWSFNDYLVWFTKAVSYMKDFLFWIEDEQDIPKDQACDLIDERTLTYCFREPVKPEYLTKISFDEYDK